MLVSIDDNAPESSKEIYEEIPSIIWSLSLFLKDILDAILAEFLFYRL